MALLEYQNTLQLNIRTKSLIYVAYNGALMNATDTNTWVCILGFLDFIIIFLMV